MSHDFKAILIGLAPSDDAVGEATPALGFGIGLARRFGGTTTLFVFVPKVSVPYSAIGGFAADVVGTENDRRRKLAEATAQTATTVAEEAGIGFTVETPDLFFEDLARRFNHQTRLHDVSVLDSGAETLAESRYGIEEALFNSGRPVIVVPKTGGNPQPRRISIAWDGSARSARAVADSLPLLAAAQKVTVVVVTGEKDLSGNTSGEELVGYLARHGIVADIAKLPAEKGDVAATLRTHITGSSAEMLVMGAFVHSWFRQTILGGVTRSLLEDAPVPLFMAY